MEGGCKGRKPTLHGMSIFNRFFLNAHALPTSLNKLPKADRKNRKALKTCFSKLVVGRSRKRSADFVCKGGRGDRGGCGRSTHKILSILLVFLFFGGKWAFGTIYAIHYLFLQIRIMDCKTNLMYQVYLCFIFGCFRSLMILDILWA